jgi:mannobiose 2-epimerase
VARADRAMNVRRPPRGLASLALAIAIGACAGAPPPAPGGAGTPPPARLVVDATLALRLAALRDRLDALGKETFEFWRAHGPDRELGGFFGTLDRRGNKIAPTDKGLIQTARHLWAMSTWYERKQPTPELKALADGLYQFLMARFYDPASREFSFTVTEAGALVEPRKILQAQALTIYALVAYARAFGAAQAGAQALATFQAVDARAHDATYGGYQQINDAPWLPPDTQKETNTQIHLMEALTSLYAYGHDATVRARLEELMAIAAGKLLQPGGYIHRFFRMDFSPIGPATVSYGHDMETGWLLLEAARAVGRGDDATLLAAAQRMIAGPAAAGYDAAAGGFFDEGIPGAGPTKREKIWWVQAEALLALWRLFELTGDGALLQRLEGTLSFIEEHQRDRAYGEWFWGLLPDGTLGPSGDVKGNAWKASYHTIRSLVFTQAWIEGAIAQANRAAP